MTLNNPKVPSPLNRFPRMMQEYLTRRVRANYGANYDRVMALSTRDEALSYIARVREKLAGVFGPWPDRTPLNVRVAAEYDRGVYVLKNILFDSRPGFTVSALLYVPKGRPGPCPAVLSPCGHSWNAKAKDVYQRYPQGLARLGYVVLVFDPMGQGERLQYPDGKGGSVWAPNEQFPSVRAGARSPARWSGCWTSA